jgi:hypothetical protein
VDYRVVDADLLPAVPVISALAVAELVSGLAAGPTHEVRRRRDANLSRIETRLESVPFDGFCACAFGPVYFAVSRIGRKPRGPRLVDLMIAATALAHELPLYTLNAADLRGLDRLIEIVDLG